MTTTEIRYPTNITQTTGGYHAEFKNKNNLGSASGYATCTIIGNYRDPSQLRLKGYGFNIPNDARVTAINIFIGHRKASMASGAKAPNIPAPTVSINGLPGTQKFPAPTTTYTKHQVRFGVDLTASFFTNNNFEVVLNYPKSSNTANGYLYLQYVSVTVEYATPSYSISANKVSGGYNLDPYTVKVDCSNVNMTNGSPSVTVNAPQGLSFKSWDGQGSVQQVSARTVKWYPALNKGTGSNSVSITWDTSVVLTSGSFTGNMNVALDNYNTASVTHVVNIVEKPPQIDEDTGDNTQNYEGDAEETPSIANVVKNEEFEYTFKIEETLYDTILHWVYNHGISEGWWTGTFEENYNNVLQASYIRFYDGKTNPVDLSKNERMSYYDTQYSTWVSTYAWLSLAYFHTNNTFEYPFRLKGTSVGYDEIYMQAVAYKYGEDTETAELEGLWKFIVIPPESELTIANYTKLEPNAEELDRLGDGYPYICQSNIKQVTSETYTRNWYKNFRIGVFNNPIEANISKYIEIKKTGITLAHDYTIPSRFDLTDCTVTFTGDHTFKHQTGLEDDEPVYETVSTVTITPVENYSIPLTIAKDSNNELVLTLTLKDDDNTTLYTMPYHITFNASEEEQATEKTTDSTDYDNLTDAEIFSNAEYWATMTAGLNTQNNVTCPFVYNENYPLYILITGDYPEGAPTTNDIEFVEPCIIEQTQYTTRETNGTFLTPILSLIDENDTAEVGLEPSMQTNGHTLYNFPLDTHYGTNDEIAIRGLAVQFTVEQANEQVLTLKLHNPNGKIGTRTLIIDDTNIDNTLTIGGNGDLWGFNTLDMTDLENWELEVSTSNILNNIPTNLNIGKAQIIFYVEKIETQNIKCWIDGENIAYYGAFIKDVDIPSGLKTDTDFLTIDGTDINDVYRQNIREKTIELELDIGDNCDLEASTSTLRQLTRLLYNERDKYNRPIPKRIEFSHYPDVYWEYIMQDTLDNPIEISSYGVKAKLTIPAGTAYSKESTTTNTIGYVQGLASINPVITATITGNNINIHETNSDQNFNLTTTDAMTGKIIEINCEDRTVTLKETADSTDTEDISYMVDYNSDWFILKNEYNFTGTNCVIRTVNYTTRE